VPLRFRYQTIEFGALDVHLKTLRDTQQYLDAAGRAEALGISSANWSLFGVIWESSRVMAGFLLDFDVEGKRILEVGCGMALSSHLLNLRHADISATDYHPEAETFLRANTALNGGRAIPYARTAWADGGSSLGRFDLVIGSDLLYERDSGELLAAFVDAHARPACEVIIVDPGRREYARFSRHMESRGFALQRIRAAADGEQQRPFPGVILRFLRPDPCG
jgi:predicted nicotinamide N-methyase